MASRTPFSPPDEAWLLAELPRHSTRNQALVLFGLRCGFRAVELGRLTIGHVWCSGDTREAVTLTRAALKGGRGLHRRSLRSRTVPLGPVVRAMLKAYVDQRFIGTHVDLNAPLFPGGRDLQGLSRWQINRIVHGIALTAGCSRARRYGSHSLRKTFANRVYAVSGRDINLTRVALGHTHITTTQKYLEVDQDAVNAAILAS